jgi:hypothetical protein
LARSQALWGVKPGCTEDFARDFVEQVLRTGLMLSNLLADLIEILPEDAYPGESSAEVVLDMLVGTVRPAAAAAGERSVREATALLAAASDRTLADLRGAVELARRRKAQAPSRRASAAEAGRVRSERPPD